MHEDPLHQKMKVGKKKKKNLPNRVAVVAATRRTGNDFLLEGGLNVQSPTREAKSSL